MKEKVEKTVEQVISDQMRKVAQALTPDQRKANGRKAWQTRRANIAKAISVKQ